MSAITLAIIMPIYNGSDTLLTSLTALNNAIQELQAQQNIVVSLVLVNDGSTDHTLDLLNEWIAQSNIPSCKVIVQSQQGPSIARNNGAVHCTEDWLLFIDSDVVLHADTLTQMFHDLPDCSRIFGINAIPSPWVPDGNWLTQYVNGSLRYQLLQHGEYVNTCFTSCCLLSRAAWNTLGQWDTSRSSRYSDDIQSRWSLPPKCIQQQTHAQFIHLKYVHLWGLLKHRFNLGYNFRSSLPNYHTFDQSILHYRYPLNVLLAGLSPLLLGILGTMGSCSTAIWILALLLTSINYQFLKHFHSQPSRLLSHILMDPILVNGLSFLEGWAMGLGILYSFLYPTQSNLEQTHERN